MRCAYHPDRNGVVQCSRCGKPLCEECASTNTRGGIPLCGVCLIEEAAQKAAQGLSEKKAEREEKRERMAAKRGRKDRLLWIAAASLGVVVLLINLFLYFSAGDMGVEPFDPHKDPIITATLIQTAIQEYAETHGNAFPESLADLRKEGVLPSDKITEEVLHGFEYRRSSPRSYELRIREKRGGAGYLDIVFTEEDY